MGEKNYDHLAGKVLEVRGVEEVEKAEVVCVDYDIGITIINADNKNHYLYCILGPVGYRTTYQKKYHGEEDYRAVFEDMVRKIESGVFDYQLIRTTLISRMTAAERFRHEAGFNQPSSKTCPFSQ